ncbi:hypothetical protein GCM10027049_06470 [Mucilaginibacter puniceus]
MLSIASCTKQTITIPDDNNLTACPVNGQCQSLFTENADVNEQDMALFAGQYRLFWDEYQTESHSTKIFVKAPMTGNSFYLKAEDIAAGKVLVIQGCPTCLMVAYKPVAGYVKGVNREPGKRADQSRWLLEAQIIRQAMNHPELKDTLYFKRYFTPNFVYN